LTSYGGALGMAHLKGCLR